jgi:hypothetical protein
LVGSPPLGRFDPLSAIRSELPASVSSALDRALSKDREDRFSDIASFWSAVSEGALDEVDLDSTLAQFTLGLRASRVRREAAAIHLVSGVALATFAVFRWDPDPAESADLQTGVELAVTAVEPVGDIAGEGSGASEAQSDEPAGGIVSRSGLGVSSGAEGEVGRTQAGDRRSVDGPPNEL